MSIYYVSAIPGAGKTTHYAQHLIRANCKTIYTCPSKDVLNRTQHCEVFHSDNVDGVARSIEQYNGQLPLATTHEAFVRIRNWSKFKDHTLVWDEVYEPISSLTFFHRSRESKDATIALLEEHCTIVLNERCEFRPKSTQPIDIRQLQNGAYQDINFTDPTYQKFFTQLSNPNFKISGTLEDWRAYKGNQDVKRICFHVDFDLNIFKTFKDVHFLAADFELSFMYACLLRNGMIPVNDMGFEPLRTEYKAEITCYYGFETDRVWSKNFYLKMNSTGKQNIQSYMDCVVKQAGSKPTIMTQNMDKLNRLDWPDQFGTKIASNCHGSNEYRDKAQIALAAAYNWTPEFIQTLKARDFDTDQILLNSELARTKQYICRTGIRDDKDTTVFVPTSGLANRLKVSMPVNSFSIKQVAGMNLVGPSPRSTKKKVLTPTERNRRYRAKKAKMQKLFSDRRTRL